jgi:hypothetical protein
MERGADLPGDLQQHPEADPTSRTLDEICEPVMHAQRIRVAAVLADARPGAVHNTPGSGRCGCQPAG